MQITKRAYLLGLLIILASVYSQYLIRGLDLVSGLLVVYGIPVLITVLLGGASTVRRAFNHSYSALKFGLGFFGAFTLLGTLVGVAIFYIILRFDPMAVNLLNRPNPVLQVPPNIAWIMVGVSLLIVGPAEEYLFRGFIYGGLLLFFKERHWLILAFISSLLFAAVHLYYALVYGIVSLIQFADLITFGMAMAATYRFSGGNLFIPSMIHGTYDAIAYVGIATSFDTGALLRNIMMLVGLVFAVVLLLERIAGRRVELPPIIKGQISFCPYCGQNVPSEAIFCPRCGKNLQHLTYGVED